MPSENHTWFSDGIFYHQAFLHMRNRRFGRIALGTLPACFTRVQDIKRGGCIVNKLIFKEKAV